MTELTKTEFVARFTAEMIRIAGPADDTSYASQAAEAYWTDPDRGDEDPEELAATDVSYWEA